MPCSGPRQTCGSPSRSRASASARSPSQATTGADARVLGFEPLERRAAGLLGRELAAHAVTPRAAQQLAHALVRQAGRAAPADADHLLGGAQRVQDGLLGGLHDGLVERVERSQGTKRSAPYCRPPAPARASAPGLAVENARKMSPEKCEPVVPVRARPSGTPPRERLALAREQRRVGGDDRDHRAGAGGRRHDGSAIGSSSPSSLADGDAAITSSRRAPKLACTNTPTV